jgi:hypothetical protein
MTILEWCKALEDTRLGELVRESAFPYIESAHVLGLALSVGTVIWFDLRLLGVTLRSQPVGDVFRGLRVWMIAGFVLMFVTGALLFTAHAAKAYSNGYFRAKIALIALAGINTAAYHFTIDRTRAEWGEAPVPPLGARAAGLVSLMVWTSVIAAGRIFAYNL